MDNEMGHLVTLIRLGLLMGGVVRAEKMGSHAVRVGVFCVRLPDLPHVRACSWDIPWGLSWLSRRLKIVRRARKDRDRKVGQIHSLRTGEEAAVRNTGYS
jgi:hypothetical protein